MDRFRVQLPLPSLALALGLAAAVALPLALHPGAYHAFELPKAMLLRGLALVALVVIGVRVAQRGVSLPNVPPLTIPVLLLGLVFLAATILSVNRGLSLWGSYERQYGLLTLGSLLVLFLSVAWGLRQRRQVEWLWSALVWASAPVVLYGLVQAAGLDPFRWQTDGTSPVLSTLGRSNFLGSYLVMVLPLSVSRLLASRRRWPYALLLLGQLACLLLSQSRGAWLGFAAAGLIFALLWAAPKQRRRLPVAVLLGTGLLLVFVLLVVTPGGPLSGLQDLPGVARMAALADTESGSTAARLTIWRTTLDLLAERPWLGYGPETMRLAFDQRFPPQLVYYQGRGLDVDRAHNLWLDLAMSGGLAAVLAFGLVVASFVRTARQQLQQSIRPEIRLAWIGLVSLVAGHLVDLQFSFETVGSAVVFWLALALAAGLARVERQGDRNPALDRPQASARRRASLIAALPLVLVATALILTLGLRPLMADLAYKESLESQPDLAERVEGAERAVSLWPLEPRYRQGLAELLVAQRSYGRALAHLSTAKQLRPNDPRLWSAMGRLYAHWAQEDPARGPLAQAAYERALALAPNVASYHTELGAVLAQRGQLELGAARTERAVHLDATDVVAYRQLAAVYEALGRIDDARWADEQARYWSSRTGGNPE